MKSLDRQSLDEQTRLVSRYVAGDLSRSERAEFEAWLIASPELASEVEMERRLRRGIASAARRGWLRRPVTAQTRHDRRWRVAIAASLLICVAVAWNVFVPRENHATLAETRAPARQVPLVGSITVRLAATRGAAVAPDIVVSRADAPGEIVIEPEVVVLTCEDGSILLDCPGGLPADRAQYPEYEMDLVDRQRATLVWRSPRQIPVSRNQISFAVRNPGNLDAGNYDLIVRGHAPDHEEVVAHFTLQVAP